MLIAHPLRNSVMWACHPVLHTEELDEIENDSNVGNDDDLKEIHFRNTQQQLWGALCIIININQTDFQ